MACSEVKIDSNIECSAENYIMEKETNKLSVSFYTRKIRRQIQQGKLIMYEDTLSNKYVLRNKHGKTISSFNKPELIPNG